MQSLLRRQILRPSFFEKKKKKQGREKDCQELRARRGVLGMEEGLVFPGSLGKAMEIEAEL